MPAPLALSPVALRLIVAGGAMVVAAAMRARRAPSHVARDEALDAVEEGVATRIETVDEGRQATVTARRRRVVRFGRRGPGIEIDLAGAVRGRVRPVPAER